MADPTQEQKPPKPSQGDVWLLVLKDMEERRQHGIEKYGTPVQPFNGRDALVDAYQEALDLCVYLRQAIEERKAEKEDVEIYVKYVTHMRNGLTKIRRLVENGDEWCKLDAGSLHLLLTEALEGGLKQ